MLALNEIELKQTRFYQEIAAEERAEGRQEGRQEGEKLLLQRQLAKRFGPLPLWTVSRLDHASMEQLELWGERIFDAAALEHIFE